MSETTLFRASMPSFLEKENGSLGILLKRYSIVLHYRDYSSVFFSFRILIFAEAKHLSTQSL
jgi:hypothetical protein